MLNFLKTGNKEPQRDPLLSLQETEPQRPSPSWVGIFLDSLLALVNITFVVFACLALRSDGQSLTPGSRAELLLTATFYGPTIFPIIFAATVGRSLKALATWELQRGSTIGRVETLSGSSTIVGALITQIELRNLSILAVGLVALWSLSPIGGQASLRVAAAGIRTSSSEQDMTFLDPNTAYRMENKPFINTLFGATLVNAKVLIGKSQDSWGNLRVPMVEAFDGYENNEWIEISDDATDTTFSSLVGIPFSPHLPNEPTSFTLNTSYMSLDCPVMKNIPKVSSGRPFTNFTRNPPPLQNPNNTWSFSYTGMSYNSSTVASNGFQIAMSDCLWGCVTYLNPQQLEVPREARRIIWESAGNDSVSHIDCALHTTYVDVKYTCTNSTCAANGVRLSPTTPGPGYFSHPTIHNPNPYDPWNAYSFTGFDRGNGNENARFMDFMTSAFPITRSYERIPALGFLLSPNNSFARPDGDVYHEDVTTLGRRVFEMRFAQLLNTFYILSVAPETIIGELAVAVHNSTSGLAYNVVRRTVTTREDERVLLCNKAWFTTMLIVCIILLFASVSGAVLRAVTLVPDVLGTLSIVTLDNRCEKPLQKASMLGGLERSRLLKDVSIKLGNVEPLGVSGRIAFAAPPGDDDMVELNESGVYE